MEMSGGKFSVDQALISRDGRNHPRSSIVCSVLIV